MAIILLFTILPVAFFLLVKATLNSFAFKATKQMQSVTAALLIFSIGLYISSIILSEKNIYFRGYRSTTFIFLFMNAMGFIFCLVYSPKAYTAKNLMFLFYLIIIPCSIISSYLVFELSDYNRNLIYDNGNYRLENAKRFISPASLPNLYIKNGIFEKKFTIPIDSYIEDLNKPDIDSVLLSEKGSDSLIIAFYHKKDKIELKNPLIKTIAVN